MTLSPWPIRTPLWPKAPDVIDPVWSVWLSLLVREVNLSVPVLFANLPATPQVGQQAVVSDSSTNTWGAAVAGGGAFTVLGWWNGVSWTVIGS